MNLRTRSKTLRIPSKDANADSTSIKLDIACVAAGPRVVETQNRRYSLYRRCRVSATQAKLDTVLAKMDDLLKSRDLQETKLNSILEKLSSLESSQEKTAADVNALKDSYSALDAQNERSKQRTGSQGYP